ncbi:retrotrans gag domain-containing protein [Citrus sinensis]|nr:retrotrans gag domain-containing protein [Citrus sinensis]
MDTRSKSNAEFRNDVNEALARHESNFDQINDSLHKVLTELQALRVSRPQPTIQPEINPFYPGETSHTTNTNTPHTPNDQHHHLKLHFPRFNGEDPNGWIYKAEQYFEFKNIAPGLQVQLASFHLEGIALQWHRRLTKFKGPLSWQEFIKAMLQRFGPTDYEDPSEALTRLKQTSTLEAYQEAFEKLSHCIDGLPENFLVGCCIAGLKDEIGLDVKIKQPRTLTDATGKMSTSFRPSAITGAQRIIPHHSSGVLGPPPTSKVNQNASNSTIPFRRITNQEARERQANGLCYYCDEKFVPGHRCQRPQLFM